jgi:hypothetical protein
MIMTVFSSDEKCFLCGETIKVGSHEIHFDGWLQELPEEYGDFHLHPACVSRLARMIERDVLEYRYGTAIADHWYRGFMQMNDMSAQKLEEILKEIFRVQ